MGRLSEFIDQAMTARGSFLGGNHDGAFRLFNGFTEGCAGLVIDVYGGTALFNDYSEPTESGSPLVREAEELVRERLNWIHTGIVKERRSGSAERRRGRLLFGGRPDERIRENRVWYAIDLQMGRDASFYLDTRDLRLWALGQLRGKSVLNAFAYTGSLGVAAAAAGARHVVQIDHNGRHLGLARRSYSLNALATNAQDLIQADFFRQAGKFRRQNRRFDCVFLDPPFFAAGSAGTVDQVHEGARLLNKARPLVEDGGWLVAINNALFISGAEYMEMLSQLCSEGYLRLVEIIPVPVDCVGYSTDPPMRLMVDPAPFNHSTKIAVLEVRRKAP